jgi:hypothetical protein
VKSRPRMRSEYSTAPGRNHLSNTWLTEGKMKSYAMMRLTIFSGAGPKQKPCVKQLVT